MNGLDSAALDRYITGNYGEDQFKNMDCDKLMRDGFCVLDPGPRGRHSTVGFFCESCSRMRRGTPAGQATDANGDVDVVFCWFCLNVEHPRRIV